MQWWITFSACKYGLCKYMRLPKARLITVRVIVTDLTSQVNAKLIEPSHFHLSTRRYLDTSLYRGRRVHSRICAVMQPSAS